VTKRLIIQTITVALAATLFAAAAEASCILLTPTQQRLRADVIFVAVALDNPTATGVQRFRISRYVKGTGPRIVRVGTGNIRRADGTGSLTSVSIVALRGQRWRIYARGSARRILRSNVCDGSRRI
jgi:hypothetical protein